MMKYGIVWGVFLLGITSVYAQEKDLTRQGNKSYEAKNYEQAEVDYLKALEGDQQMPEANFNLGNTNYQLNRAEEAVKNFELAASALEDDVDKAAAYHNIGNTFAKAKQYDKALEAYKQALRLNPKDEETRYNYALAKEKLQQQQDQNKDDQNKDDQNKDDQNKDDQNKDDQNKDDQNKDDQNKDDQNKDDQNKDDQNKDDQNKDDQNKDDQNKDDQNKDDQNSGDQQQPKASQLSPEEIQRLLEAMSKEEDKVQDKVKAQKLKAPKRHHEKDW